MFQIVIQLLKDANKESEKGKKPVLLATLCPKEVTLLCAAVETTGSGVQLATGPRTRPASDKSVKGLISVEV